MDRAAVLLNLRDLRDLELAKICIDRSRNEEWNAYQKEINELSTANYKPIQSSAYGPSAGLMVACIIGAVVSLAIVIISFQHTGSGEHLPFFMNFFIIIFRTPILALLGIVLGVPAFVFCLFGVAGEVSTIRGHIDMERQNNSAQQHNASEDKRIAKNQPKIHALQQKQQDRDNYWIDQINQVEHLLTDAYAVNLIPTIYRENLAAIQYIFEYMSSAPVSLEHTLLSTKIEEGIQRIEAKLDTIISRQDEAIFQMHRLEAQNQNMMEQNTRMLDSLRRTEANTMEAAQYSQLSASYNQTCAFFATFNYLTR